MRPFDFVLLALATYRIANDVSSEGGPFDLYTTWRGIIRERYGADSWIDDGFNCPVCLSLYVGLLMLLLYQHRWGRGIVKWLAIAGVTSAITGLTD